MQSKLLWLIPITALLVALLDMPYGYYQLLRVLIFCVSGYLAFEAIGRSQVNWAWVFGGTALVYNPLIKLALGRDLWSMVNVATAVLLAFYLYWKRHSAHQHPEPIE